MNNLFTNRFAALGLAAALTATAMAASHSDAPMMIADPSANITDVYAFVGMNAKGAKVLNIIMQTNPLEDPGNGVMFYKFAEDIRYTIHIQKVRRDASGNVMLSPNSETKFNFKFTSGYKNPGTILSYGLGTAAGPIMATGDAQQNLTQTYTVERVNFNGSTFLSMGQPMLVPPPNVGPRTTPKYYDGNGDRIQGASNINAQPSYTRETTYGLPDGIRVHAGQREDGFYADTAGIFDFLGVRSPGKDSFSGYNVQAICIQVPINSFVKAGQSPELGVWATTERQSVSVRNTMGKVDSGPWVQVSRMGNPLFNETLVALRDKDNYNMTSVYDDETNYKQYADNCELAFLLNAVLGTSFQVSNRADLVGFFVPDILKIDTSTAAVPLSGQPGFNRLSVFGGDTIFSPFAGKNVASGWPNGRRLGDDVVDIALTAVASGPTYSTITPISDNANTNDSVYDLIFPYAGTPFGGPTSTLH